MFLGSWKISSTSFLPENPAVFVNKVEIGESTFCLMNLSTRSATKSSGEPQSRQIKLLSPRPTLFTLYALVEMWTKHFFFLFQTAQIQPMVEKDVRIPVLHYYRGGKKMDAGRKRFDSFDEHAPIMTSPPLWKMPPVQKEPCPINSP